MPLLEKGIRAATQRMPKMLSPGAHAAVDLALAGSFAILGAVAWRRNRKASVCAFIAAATELGLSLATDYPAGAIDWISFPTHGEIDSGLSGLIGSMPSLMGFGYEWPSGIFHLQALSIAALTGLTEFRHSNNRPRVAGPRVA